MTNAILKMSQELAAEITEEVKHITARLQSENLSQFDIAELARVKKELNKERIKALGLFLIEGGKYE